MRMLNLLLATIRWFPASGMVLFLAMLMGAEAALGEETIQHRFLVMEFWKGRVLYVDQKDHSKNWEMPWAGGLRDWQLVGQNRLLISCPDGYTVYDLASRRKTEEFHHRLLSGTTTACRRPDGTTWLGANQGKNVCVFSLDRANNVTQTITLAGLKWLRTMRFTGDNRLLLSEWDGATEISVAPGVTDRIAGRFKLPRPRNAYMAVKADDGTYWVAGGYAQGLFQYKPDGTLLREFQAKQPAGFANRFYAGFQLLKNGHVVQANWTGHNERDFNEGWKLIEFDSAGKVVWHWHVPREQAGSISGVLVLDDLDTTAPMFPAR